MLRPAVRPLKHLGVIDKQLSFASIAMPEEPRMRERVSLPLEVVYPVDRVDLYTPVDLYMMEYQKRSCNHTIFGETGAN